MAAEEANLSSIERELFQRVRRSEWRRAARTEEQAQAAAPCACGLSHSQLPPDGDWRVWYLRGGRGAGKTRAGAETLADWITSNDPGEWAILAPTFGDAKSVCAEGKASGLIKVLGGYPGPLVENWNRSEGVIYVAGGSEVYLDGANDGALRVQGRNLKGAWCDEVGLWEKWDTAWNYSLQPAVRMNPGRIIATGTPKMAHPLVALLINSPNVIEHHMRTIDNAGNLSKQSVDELHQLYGGSTLGRQELEGEFIEALEGSILHRTDWQWYPVSSSFYGREFGPAQVRALPTFERIVHSWDTALKDKTSSDYVSGQVWGLRGPDRYLLRLWHGHASLAATITAMRELRQWTDENWPRIPSHVLIENTANGPEAIGEMRKSVDGVTPVAAKGDKVQRALSAAVALETGHCHLPGDEDTTASGRGYGPGTPTGVQAFVEECAMFRGDMRHSHDDQVDAWSQMVNWTRERNVRAARVGRTSLARPELGSLSVAASRR